MPSPVEIVLEYVCPSLGLIVCNFMWTAPLKDLRIAVERGNGLGDLNPTPWAFMLGNCVGWTTYGVLINNWFVFWANYPGFLISCWLNLGAVKLIYSSHHTNETRRSLAEYLSSSTAAIVRGEKDGVEDAQQRRFLVHEGVTISQRGEEKEVEFGDGTTNTNTSPPSLAVEDPDDIVPHHSNHTLDWTKIIWEVTSQSTPAKANHEYIVLGMVILWSLLLGGIGFYSHFSVDDNSEIGKSVVGYVVNVNLIFFYGAPLSAIGKVLKSKKSDALHFLTMITNTSNALFWTAYSLAPQINDPFIYVPNFLGVILGIIQIALWAIFPKTKTTEDPEPASSDDSGTKDSHITDMSNVKKTRADTITTSNCASANSLSSLVKVASA